MRVRVVVEYDIPTGVSYAKIKSRVKELLSSWPRTLPMVFLSVEKVDRNRTTD